MKYITWLMFVPLLFCLTSVAAKGEKFNILVIPKDDTTQYWNWVKQGAIAAGKDCNAKIIFRGPRSPDDYDAQKKIIETGIAENADAIVIAPNHTTKTVAILNRAMDKGIKVVVIDSNMEIKRRTSYVASNNFKAGWNAAKYILSLISSNDDILVVRYKQNNDSTMEREKGFAAAVAKLSPENHIIYSEYVGSYVGDIYHISKAILQKQPEIKAVFASAEAITVGCLRALDELKLTGQIKFVGFDYTSNIQKALDEKKIQGVILQRPYKMGYLGVMAACDALEGKPVSPRIEIETTIGSDSDTILKYISTLKE